MRRLSLEWRNAYFERTRDDETEAGVVDWEAGSERLMHAVRYLLQEGHQQPSAIRIEYWTSWHRMFLFTFLFWQRKLLCIIPISTCTGQSTYAMPIASWTLPLWTVGNVTRNTMNWLSLSIPALNGWPSKIPWVLKKSLSAWTNRE